MCTFQHAPFTFTSATALKCLYNMGHVQSSEAMAAMSTDPKNIATGDIMSTSKPPIYEKTKQLEVTGKKKKFIRLGTIKRKLANTFRSGKSSDHRKNIRDLLRTWSIKDIKLFVKEYEGLLSLKGLRKRSDFARPKSSSLQNDLKKLHAEGYCFDIVLEYQGRYFPVHKAILWRRCQFFKSYLSDHQVDENNVLKLDVDDLNLNGDIFYSLLQYIYCGFTEEPKLIEVLSQLGEKFGLLNVVEYDMRTLLLSEEHADVVLVFPNNGYIENKEDSSIDNTLEIYCHAALLCSRSSFFQMLLIEKFKTKKTSLLRLIISESVLPRPYIRVILKCMYSETIDLNSLIKWKVTDDGAGEADRLLTTAELAMELYEIGQFLDFPILMQGCEDLIVKNLNSSSLLGVLEWSSQPFGSQFVHRQALYYFREEFCSLCKTSVFLANLPKKFMLEAIKSDFLQASEEFVLATVIKWGEWQVAKANEKPGMSPTNSLPRRSPKRKDISNEVLKEMISDLLPHIRLKHILPPNSSILHTAYQNNLLQRPFPFDVVASEKLPPSIVFWVRDMRHSEYVRPRLFTQYLYESKMVLHERLNTETENSNLQHSHCMPDMLPSRHLDHSKLHVTSDEEEEFEFASALDILQLDETTIKNMVLREKQLKTSEETLRALPLLPDSREISDEVQLRVVREFGFPDEIAREVFKQAPDLIEDSSSGNSSKQSTLSKVSEDIKKVGHMLKDDEQQQVRCILKDDEQVENILKDDDTVQVISITADHLKHSEIQDLVPNTDVQYTGPLSLQDHAVESLDDSLNKMCLVEDSPLDLPSHEQILDLQIPNVLMDT